VEDWLIIGWVAIASPLAYRETGSAEPFDSGHPLLGAVQLAAVLAALACLAARRRVADGSAQDSATNRALVGPLTGGLLLVAISGFVALDASQPVVLAVAAATAILMVAVRLRVPPLPAQSRRVLMSPFVLVTGGIFWSVIEAVSGPNGGGVFGLQAIDLLRTPTALLFFAAFSGVYYAMLIYAPRQAADREGGPVTWIVRYVAFGIGVIFGLGWLRIFGT
jgi:hypothetical protein